MNMERWKELKGKDVYIELKSGRRYSGELLELSNDYTFITILDKYNKKVSINSSEISVIEEQMYTGRLGDLDLQLKKELNEETKKSNGRSKKSN